MGRADAAAALKTSLSGPAGSSACAYVRAEEGLDGVLFMEVMGRIVRIDITTPGISTAEGVEVGTAVPRVLDVYGPGLTKTPHKYTDGNYFTVAPDAEHRIVFETDRQYVTRYRVGRVPEVEWVEGCS